MKEFVITEAKVETAVIVGIITPQQNERKTNEYLDELEFLAETAGAKVVRRFTQRVTGPSSVTYIGTGKLQEIRDYIKQQEEARDAAIDAALEQGFDISQVENLPELVGMVIFDDELTAKQIRNIEKELQVKSSTVLRSFLISLPCVLRLQQQRHRLNLHNISICFRASPVCGLTLNASEEEVWACADREKHSLKWTSESYVIVWLCLNSVWQI